MSDQSHIQWCDATWNTASGCTKVSDGCTNCYIERTPPFRMNGRKFDSPGVGGTTGVVLHEDRLALPLSWRKPRRVFVNSLTDLFHESVPDAHVAKVFAVMAATPQHTYQLLTKRHGRMRSLLNSLDFKHMVAREIDSLAVEADHLAVETWLPVPDFEGYEASSHGRVRSARGILSPSTNSVTGRDAVTLWRHNSPKTMTVHRLVLMAHSPTSDPSLEACHRNGDKRDNRLANLRWGTRSENQREKTHHGSRGGGKKLTSAQADEIRRACAAGATHQQVADRFGVTRSLISMIMANRAWVPPQMDWPLPNVHLGVSCEDQRWADIRIPALLATPAAVRFISAEPLLGLIDLFGDVHAGHEWETEFGRPVCLTCTGDGPAVEYFEREHRIDGLNWLIAGAESGAGARPMNLDWVRSLRDQCVEAGVAFFFKQDAVNGRKIPTPELDGRVWVQMPRVSGPVAV